jgi:hypothetical protein
MCVPRIVLIFFHLPFLMRFFLSVGRGGSIANEIIGAILRVCSTVQCVIWATPFCCFFFVSKEKHNGTTRNEELAVIKSRIRARGKYSHHLLFFVFLFFNLCFFFTAVHLKIVNGHA